MDNCSFLPLFYFICVNFCLLSYNLRISIFSFLNVTTKWNSHVFIFGWYGQLPLWLFQVFYPFKNKET